MQLGHHQYQYQHHNGNKSRRFSPLRLIVGLGVAAYTILVIVRFRQQDLNASAKNAEMDALQSFRGQLESGDGAQEREKLLFMLSSFDRGQRLANWKGKDKMPIILRVVDLARELCEYGYDVDFHMISAWPSSNDREEIESHLSCQRTGSTIPIHFMDHFNASVEGKLAYQHRYVVMRELYNYDFFISIEDDMLFTVDMVEAFRRHCNKIQASIGPRSRYFFPGFVRYEVNQRWENKSHCLWEGTAKDFGVVKLGDAGWYAKTHSFSNQACWMASRDQVLFFNTSCNEHFFPPWGPGWVEYWSGGLQIYEQCKMRKVLPLEEFETFTTHHMTDNKLYMRGVGVTQIPELLIWLNQLKQRCEEEGVDDSNLLKSAPPPPYTIPLEVNR